jgi:hypothetical protein
LTSPANAALPPVNASTAAETATTTSRFIPPLTPSLIDALLEACAAKVLPVLNQRQPS